MTTPAARHGAAERRRSRSGRALLLVLVIAAVAAAAWQWLAPTQFGGQTTYALVTGQSMEPTLASGTLVVARSRESYHTGQIVVFDAKGGHVLHRIVAGDAVAGWHTKGDNNNWWDPWDVANSDVRGEKVLAVPGLGAVLSWFIARPALAAASAAAVVLVFALLPRHRRRVTPYLAAALRRSTPPGKASTSARQASGSGLVAACLLGAILMTLGATVLALVRGSPVWPNLVLAVAGLTICSVATLVVNGVARLRWHPIAGHDEELASLDSARIWPHKVPADERVAAGHRPRFVHTAAQLSELASSYRLPVLRRVDPVNGRSDYVLITADGDFVWHPIAAPHHGRRCAHHASRVGHPVNVVVGAPGAESRRPAHRHTVVGGEPR